MYGTAVYINIKYEQNSSAKYIITISVRVLMLRINYLIELILFLYLYKNIKHFNRKDGSSTVDGRRSCN